MNRNMQEAKLSVTTSPNDLVNSGIVEIICGVDHLLERISDDECLRQIGHWKSFHPFDNFRCQIISCIQNLSTQATTIAMLSKSSNGDEALSREIVVNLETLFQTTNLLVTLNIGTNCLMAYVTAVKHILLTFQKHVGLILQCKQQTTTILDLTASGIAASAGSVMKACESATRQLPTDVRMASRHFLVGHCLELRDSITEFTNLISQGIQPNATNIHDEDDDENDCYSSHQELAMASSVIKLLSTCLSLLKLSILTMTSLCDQDEYSLLQWMSDLLNLIPCISSSCREAAMCLYPPIDESEAREAYNNAFEIAQRIVSHLRVGCVGKREDEVVLEFQNKMMQENRFV